MKVFCYVFLKPNSETHVKQYCSIARLTIKEDVVKDKEVLNELKIGYSKLCT